MKLHFVVNETAGSGRGAKKWQAIKAELRVHYTMHRTNYAQHAAAIVEQIAAQQERACIIAVGGDGTMNEVISAARRHKHIVVGIVAAGSGNDFARAFPTFQTAADIEQFLQHEQTASYDCGIVRTTNRELNFMNNSGIGFDAYVANCANASTLKRKLNRFKLGKLSYIYFVIVGLFRFQPFTVTVDDGQSVRRYEQVWFATICNQPYFGGGMKLSPQSRADDGQLELTIVHHLAKWKFLTMFGTVFAGQHTRFKEVEQHAAAQFTIQLQQPVPMHTDGEKVDLANEQQLHFTVAQKSWQLAQKE